MLNKLLENKYGISIFKWLCRNVFSIIWPELKNQFDSEGIILNIYLTKEGKKKYNNKLFKSELIKIIGNSKKGKIDEINFDGNVFFIVISCYSVKKIENKIFKYLKGNSYIKDGHVQIISNIYKGDIISEYPIKD